MKHTAPIAKRLTTVWLLLFGIAAAGCGFQPRGQAVGLSALPGPVHISGIPGYSPLHHELSRQLRAAGAELAGRASESAAVLRVADYRQGNRVLSVNARNKAVEYELEESLDFSLRTTDGREIAAEQTVRVVRLHYRPEDAVLAGDREAETLRDEMRRDLAARIVRRLAAAY